MKEFQLDPIDWKRTYYPNPRSTVSFTEAWDKVDGDDNPVYSTTSNYFLTKTITYTDEVRFRRDAENLERLKEAKFDIIKIPQYSFEASNNVIQYTCQYLKGYPTKQSDMIKLYDDLVLRESEYTFADFNIMNFITVNHPQLSGVYAIDLNSYRKVSMDLRIFLWERNASLPNPNAYA